MSENDNEMLSKWHCIVHTLMKSNISENDNKMLSKWHCIVHS